MIDIFLSCVLHIMNAHLFCIRRVARCCAMLRDKVESCRVRLLTKPRAEIYLRVGLIPAYRQLSRCGATRRVSVAVSVARDASQQVRGIFPRRTRAPRLS